LNEDIIEKFCKFNIITADKLNLEIRKYQIVFAILIILFIASITFNVYNMYKGKAKIKEN